jgi:hypothetical protein
MVMIGQQMCGINSKPFSESPSDWSDVQSSRSTPLLSL